MKKPFVFNKSGQIVVTKVEFPEICPHCSEKAVGHGFGYEFDADENILQVLIECPQCENYYHTFHSFNPTTRECQLLNTRILKEKKKEN